MILLDAWKALKSRLGYNKRKELSMLNDCCEHVWGEWEFFDRCGIRQKERQCKKCELVQVERMPEQMSEVDIKTEYEKIVAYLKHRCKETCAKYKEYKGKYAHETNCPAYDLDLV